MKSVEDKQARKRYRTNKKTVWRGWRFNQELYQKSIEDDMAAEAREEEKRLKKRKEAEEMDRKALLRKNELAIQTESNYTALENNSQSSNTDALLLPSIMDHLK